jgi:hypothetical protein
MIRTPAHYQRRARRRLARLALYWIFGSFGAGLLYVTAGYYLPLFI